MGRGAGLQARHHHLGDQPCGTRNDYFRGATPSFLGLYGFPAAACISVNEELIHGIPDKKHLIKEGDIVSIDVGACIGGYHGDSAYTVGVGEIAPETKQLLEVTQGA